MTLGEWLDQWLEELVAPSVRESTLEGYRHHIQYHIKPRLGSKPISKITPDDVRKLYRDVQNHGRIREDPEYGHALSASSIRRLHGVLHLAMDAAVRARLIPQNPTQGVTLPKKETAPRKILNDAQLERFMEEIRKDPIWSDFFYTELTTGLRKGEICGLMWSDFDEAHGTLSIRRTVHAQKGGRLTTGETKTGTGKRTITLPPSTAKLLAERKARSYSEWIFPDPLRPERPTRPNAAYVRMKELLKKAGLPSIRFHDLRHTFATHALASGVDAKTLSCILGHTKASFTLDTYAHVTGDMQRQAAQVMDTFMTDIFGKELAPWQSGESPAAAAST